jgi:predicted dehydrogenase
MESIDKKLRLGVVGCGRVFEKLYLPALKRLDEWNLVAVCDPSEERRKWARHISENLYIFHEFGTFSKNCPVDAVLVVTPPEFHCQYSVQALEKGAHVLVEKPMAPNVADGARMVDMAAKQKKKLWVGFQRRFRETFFQLKREISPVRPDAVSSISYEMILNPQGWQSVSDFLGDEEKGGDIFDDVFSHQVNLMTWLLNGEVAQVRAEPRQYPASGTRCIAIDLLFKNGLRVQCLAGHGTKYGEKLNVNLKDRSFVVYPGHLLHTQSSQPKWADPYGQLRTHGHNLWHKIIRTPNLTLESTIRQLHEFASAIREKPRRFRGSSGEEGLNGIKVIEACRRSCHSGSTWLPVENSGGG